MPDFIKKFLKVITVGLLLFPLKNGSKLPQAAADQSNVRSADVKKENESKVLGLAQENETTLPPAATERFLAGPDLTIFVDGSRNKLMKLPYTDASKPALLQILKIFHPEFSRDEAEQYLESYSVLVGEDVDQYLESGRKGSWGTTVMSVGDDGKIHFKTISLRQFLIEPGYQESRPGALNQLIQEEFFQAHQYEEVVAGLYNQGYIAVAGIQSPEDVAREISTGNLRAFLELFPQQKYLLDSGFGKNSYTYFIGNELFQETVAHRTIDAPYFAMVSIIQDDLGLPCSVESFLDPQFIQRANKIFREKYLNYYQGRGVSDRDVQLWNLVGMYRKNEANPANTLDMKAKLELPEVKN